MGKHMSVAAVLLFLFCLAGMAWESGKSAEEEPIRIKVETVHMDLGGELYTGPADWLAESLNEQEKKALIRAFSLEEADVYSFLQGPRSWAESVPWSGEWCQFRVEGNPFGGFGCGLCCMANIYDTLSPYEVSPLDMYGYAIEASDYAPEGEAGAIDWADMRDSLRACGISCRLRRKPESYRKFQRQMARAKSAVVLVSSFNDDAYWQDTPGHYVNLWLYREEDDTVFLAEPGSPENNRSRIPLRYVYDALKTVSRFQYLTVGGYAEQKNAWKADGIDENWNRPS